MKGPFGVFEKRVSYRGVTSTFILNLRWFRKNLLKWKK